MGGVSGRFSMINDCVNQEVTVTTAHVSVTPPAAQLEPDIQSFELDLNLLQRLSLVCMKLHTLIKPHALVPMDSQSPIQDYEDIHASSFPGRKSPPKKRRTMSPSRQSLQCN